MNVCRQCGGPGARYVHVELSVLKRTRAMELLVCRDCFRTLEALMEPAAAALQESLIEYHENKGVYPNFLW